MNWQLLSMLWSMSATVLTGILMTTALVLGYGNATYIIGAAVVGMLLAVPIALIVTKKIKSIG